MNQQSQSISTRAAVQERSQLYIELTKPRITLMVMLTVAIGFALAPAAGGMALVHVLVGAMLSCSGAGALNQFFERDTDAAMARTRFRPLPAHRVSPIAALAVGLSLAVGGLAYLVATTNVATAAVDALTLLTYLALYTPLKRATSISTLVGAVPGALPPVMGWAAATGTIGSGAIALFAVMFLWQIPHFLAIGRMYRDDYAAGGFPMLSVVDGSGRITARQMVLYSLALIPVSLAPTMIELSGALYFWSALLLGVAYLGASLRAAVDGGTRSARTLLLTSVLYLPLLFAALFVDRFAA